MNRFFILIMIGAALVCIAPAFITVALSLSPSFRRFLLQLDCRRDKKTKINSQI